jgi:lysophospholipase L1-like esterase
MKIAKGSKLVFIGDSITDAGRARPAVEGLFDPLGRGYVNLVNALLGAVCPQQAIRVVNVGNGGDRSRDLPARWQSDVLDQKPDWLSIMIGINDVWRQFDSPLQKELHVPIGEYAATLEDLVSRTLPKLAGLVMMTPYYIEPNRQEPMRAMMDRYGAAMKKVARRHGAILVDVQAAFDQALKTTYAGALAWDRVHPNQAGHMLIAKAFLDAVGFEWK